MVMAAVIPPTPKHSLPIRIAAQNLAGPSQSPGQPTGSPSPSPRFFSSLRIYVVWATPPLFRTPATTRREDLEAIVYGILFVPLSAPIVILVLGLLLLATGAVAFQIRQPDGDIIRPCLGRFSYVVLPWVLLLAFALFWPGSPRNQLKEEIRNRVDAWLLYIPTPILTA